MAAIINIGLLHLLFWSPDGVPTGLRVRNRRPCHLDACPALRPLSSDGMARLTGGVDCSGGAGAQNRTGPQLGKPSLRTNFTGIYPISVVAVY